MASSRARAWRPAATSPPCTTRTPTSPTVSRSSVTTWTAAAIPGPSTASKAGSGVDLAPLAAELADILDRIRGLEGFESFALPPTVDELLAEAAHGPIVTFSVSSHRCDALVLTAEGVTAVPLTTVTADLVYDQIDAFQFRGGRVLRRAGRPCQCPGEGPRDPGMDVGQPDRACSQNPGMESPAGS